MVRSETENIQPSVTLEGSRSLSPLYESHPFIHRSMSPVSVVGTFVEKLWMCDSSRSVEVTKLLNLSGETMCDSAHMITRRICSSSNYYELIWILTNQPMNYLMIEIVYKTVYGFNGGRHDRIPPPVSRMAKRATGNRPESWHETEAPVEGAKI